MLISPALEMLNQEDNYEFETILDYVVILRQI